MLFLAIIVRVLVRLLDEEDSFLILAVAGLIAQLGDRRRRSRHGGRTTQFSVEG